MECALNAKEIQPSIPRQINVLALMALDCMLATVLVVVGWMKFSTMEFVAAFWTTIQWTEYVANANGIKSTIKG
jgi:hypothetical protein